MRILLVEQRKKIKKENAQGIYRELKFSDSDILLTVEVMKAIEIEFKNLLTQKEYQTLLYSFNATENKLFTQINSYFDTPD